MKTTFYLPIIILFLSIMGLNGCGSISSSATTTVSDTGSGSTTDTNGGSSSDSTSGIVVQNKAFSTVSNQELQINLISLVNSIVSSKKYTFTIISLPNLGIVDLNNEILVYHPSEIGSDEIKYKVSDGSNDSNIGKITIVVNNIVSGGGVETGSSLVLIKKSVVSLENEDVVIDLSTMIKDFNASSDYNIILKSEPSLGTAKINGLTLTYKPNVDVLGNDVLSIQAGDGFSSSNTVDINIEIQSLSSSAPRLQDVEFNIKPNVAAVLDLKLLLLPPHPFSDKTYTFTILQQGKLGTGVISGTDLTYTPILNAFGKDTSLRVLVKDELGQKDDTPITIIISNN